MSYDGGLAEDLAVYSFNDLGNQESDLAHLLDDDANALNDETFGALEGGDDEAFGADDAFGAPVGRDFDFAGSTARFLGHDQAPSSAAKPLQQPSTAWTDPLLSSSKPLSSSPWTSLNDDPLLSSAGKPAYTQPPPAVPQPSRQVKTLEEVEAEMRAAALARQQQQQQPAQASARPMTLEEVEAEMLRRRGTAAAAASPAVPPAQPQTQQLPPGLAPQQQTPLTSAPQLPFNPATFNPATFIPPAHLLPPNFTSLPPQIQQQIIAQHRAAAAAAVAAGTFRPPLPQQPPQPAQSQSPAFGRPPQGPGTPGPAFPPLGASATSPVPAAAGGPNLMATLFPPLPSASGAQGPVSVEQGLQMLSLSQHTQHPSLTGAQLQALLHQAQSQAQGGGEGGEEEEKKKAADELVRMVEKRIMEHEEAEGRRKRKAAKIASMAKHNNLMSNSDKDFITRIQVSQLVTDDPYADDFYFHIMAAIKASRQQALAASVGGPLPGPGLVPPQGPNTNSNANRRPTRRENAMNRMAQNVQRLVDSAKKRNATGGGSGGAGHTLSLEGALGKIATRTRSAPRPLLQVKPSSTSVHKERAVSEEQGAEGARNGTGSPDAEKQQGQGGKKKVGAGVSTGQSLLAGAGLITTTSSASDAASAPNPITGPLSHRDALAIIEKIYDCVLDLEQLRRIQPALFATAEGVRAQYEQMTVEGEVREQIREKWDEAKSAVQEAEDKYKELVDRLWDNLHVMEPLDACTPHPFISILSPLKGKRILPRAIRHLSPEQTLTLLTLLVATFDTLDVVVEAPVLDQLDTTASGRQRRVAVEAKTEALLNSIVAPIMAVVGQAQLRMVVGMLGLLMDRNDIIKVVRSKPGLAFLTILLSRAESLKQATPAPEQADLQQWHRTFTHLFGVLSSGSNLMALFPSTRLAAALPFGVAQYQSLEALRPEADQDDEPVWRFLASVAVCADPDQQQVLVTGVRDKVIENVRSARQLEKVKAAQAPAGAPEKAALKIRNVNLLLHALSLDASMIETDDD
ncbi:DNA topoisomerase 2-associated protein PAT1 [Rhodotorula toruloides]|uniref:BY PROTMAP: gi/472587392/gb/EMS24891.1/ DNA topoisomerase 2-associated protein PAT1 [Rhodosporidium toruloides NP11] gi/647401322/emb/CDR47487.1/ RHTO0S14e04192g1_1 [Rhodosporidium toruloides] n=1 Tax=Rhodotorula toruloides TaxID=5286 RepID=A0A0K3C7F9_RHOTO|nr:DNA topoisomerase 2-associated protein PAT1 [Rhodotorula toruloides]PRQ77249.1 Topoisomerase II-associated protein PAT1-domain containing protein [Rhodotorula toruloides]